MSMTLRVLLVGPLPPPSGGMAVQMQQLARLLEGEGARVSLVQTNAPYSPAWIGTVRGVRAVFRLLPFVASVRRAAKMADIVHVMANSGWAWRLMAAPAIHEAHKSGNPVVVHYHGGLAKEFLATNVRWVRRDLLRSDALVVPSSFLEQIFSAFGIKATIVPNVVDVGLFRPARTTTTNSAAPVIVVARNLEKIYGIDTALRAFSLLRGSYPAAHLYVAGSGPERAELGALVEDLGLVEAVTFTGPLAPAEMVALYQRANVVLNPSRADNTPISILESLACGVPVVSTNVGGVPYMVDHDRTACLVPPDNPVEMAAALDRVLTDSVLRHKLIINGLCLAQACSLDAVKHEWLAIYQRLIMARTVSGRR